MVRQGFNPTGRQIQIDARESYNAGLVSSGKDLAQNKASACRLASLDVSADVSDAILDAVKHADIDIQDVLLAAFVHGLRKWKGVSEVEVCIETHGRDFANEAIKTSRTVG